MVKEKVKVIKTADFEAEVRKLEQEIMDIDYITKTACLSLVKAFRDKLVTYEPVDEIVIPKFMWGGEK